MKKITLAEHMAQQLNAEVLHIANPEERHVRKSRAVYLQNVTPERFLHLYRHAAIILTDSFHGTCFSIKFEKTFISLVNREKIRFEIFKKMGLGNRIYNSTDDIVLQSTIYSIDYTNIQTYINNMSVQSLDWIKNKLQNKDKTYENFESFYPFYDLEHKKIACRSMYTYVVSENIKKNIEHIKEQLQRVDDTFSHNRQNIDALLLITHRFDIYRKYYESRWIGLLPIPWAEKHRKRAAVLHELVRRIRRSKKEFRRILRDRYHV